MYSLLPKKYIPILFIIVTLSSNKNIKNKLIIIIWDLLIVLIIMKKLKQNQQKYIIKILFSNLPLNIVLTCCLHAV